MTGPRHNDPAGARSLRLPARVLGVDPGSEATGYGVIESEGSRYQLIEYAAIRVSSRLSPARRLLVISQKLEEVIERLRPDVCAVEETFYGVNVKSALKLGHVRGLVLVAAARAGLEVFEYSPLEIKSALVGYGRAEKQQVQEMVRRLLRLSDLPQPLDASDALACAICHANTHSTRSLREQAAEALISRTRGKISSAGRLSQAAIQGSTRDDSRNVRRRTR